MCYLHRSIKSSYQLYARNRLRPAASNFVALRQVEKSRQEKM